MQPKYKFEIGDYAIANGKFVVEIISRESFGGHNSYTCQLLQIEHWKVVYGEASLDKPQPFKHPMCDCGAEYTSNPRGHYNWCTVMRSALKSN